MQPNVHFFVNNELLEIVDSFCYLGIKFTRNGSLIEAISTLSDQALKALNGLYVIFSRVYMDVKTKLLLFDRMVLPILLYCAEVWGIYNIKDIEKIHIKFCKRILGLKSQTPNMAVLGELGRYPLLVMCKERVLKYFFKIMKDKESIMYKFLMKENS